MAHDALAVSDIIRLLVIHACSRADVFSLRRVNRTFKRVVDSWQDFWRTILPPQEIGESIWRGQNYKSIDATSVPGAVYSTMVIHHFANARFLKTRATKNVAAARYRGILKKIETREHNISRLRREIASLEQNALDAHWEKMELESQMANTQTRKRALEARLLLRSGKSGKTKRRK